MVSLLDLAIVGVLSLVGGAVCTCSVNQRMISAQTRQRSRTQTFAVNKSPVLNIYHAALRLLFHKIDGNAPTCGWLLVTGLAAAGRAARVLRLQHIIAIVRPRTHQSENAVP